MIYLSEQLRALRRARDLTQEEVASALHVSPQSVSKWERGESYPDIELLPALPGAWPEGSVTGLRASGDWTVDFAWKDGAVTHCAVKAGVGGKLRVKINGRLFERDMKSGETFRHTVD